MRETAFREHVGFLPENPWFHDFLTGREFLRFYAQLGKVPRAEREAPLLRDIRTTLSRTWKRYRSAR